MCKFIGIDDLAANALIELIDSNKSPVVSFKSLSAYANAIIRILKDEQDEEVVAIYSRDSRDRFLRNYSDLFSLCDMNGEMAIKFIGTSTDEIRRNFRTALKVDWIVAFRRAAKEVFQIVA